MEKSLNEKLTRLANLTKNEIGENENDVKYHFITPFLECFGYKGFKFEHSAQGGRIDIFIDSNYNIVIETKGYSKKLDNLDFIMQLKRYCDEKRPLLAILANGEEIRFYSPFFIPSEFANTLLYSIKRDDLKNYEVVNRIEKILSQKNLEDESIDDFIRERVSEIKKAKKEINEVQNSFKEQTVSIETEIKEIEEQIENFKIEVEQKQKKIHELDKVKNEEIKNLSDNYFIPRYHSASQIQKTTENVNKQRGRGNSDVLKEQIIPIINNIPIKEDEQWLRQLDSSGTQGYLIYNYIKERKQVSREQLYSYLKEKGSKFKSDDTPSGGSIPMIIKVLERNNYIIRDGRGNNTTIKLVNS